MQRTSPPTPLARAMRSVITPRGVERTPKVARHAYRRCSGKDAGKCGARPSQQCVERRTQLPVDGIGLLCSFGRKRAIGERIDDTRRLGGRRNVGKDARVAENVKRRIQDVARAAPRSIPQQAPTPILDGDQHTPALVEA